LKNTDMSRSVTRLDMTPILQNWNVEDLDSYTLTELEKVHLALIRKQRVIEDQVDRKVEEFEKTRARWQQ
jgi:hypothetical protein